MTPAGGRRRAAALVLLACTAMLAAGCGAGAAASPGARPGAPQLPTVSGPVGAEPTVAIPHRPAPATAERSLVHRGTGPPVAEGDLAVLDYVGRFWTGDVFDDSYRRPGPGAFRVTSHSFFPGFADAVRGVPVGSRVLAVVPPPAGSPPHAGTLVFVLDVLRTYRRGAAGDPRAVPQRTPPATPVVRGRPGTAPGVTLPARLAAPSRVRTVVLARGHGPPVVSGLLVAQVLTVDRTGRTVSSTWSGGTPTALPVGGDGPPTFDGLQGIPLGSRVLIEAPACRDGVKEVPALTYVVDMVDQPRRSAAG